MTIGSVMKMLQFAVLQDSGIPVLPEQLGLKARNPGALSALPGNNNLPFSQVLLGGQPPALPKNPTDPAQQAQFQQALALYQAQVMQQFLQRLMLTQQQARMMSGPSGASAVAGGAVSGAVGLSGGASDVTPPVGVGGIV